ncbi:hypothetical protein MCOR11_003263 [Pyricularia oryzae]|nr:hypothetical protein MCOR11_003263 [Pyricularia oryzae]
MNSIVRRRNPLRAEVFAPWFRDLGLELRESDVFSDPSSRRRALATSRALRARCSSSPSATLRPTPERSAWVATTTWCTGVMGHASAAKECVSYCVLWRLYGADPPLSEWYRNCGGYEVYMHNGFTHEWWCLTRA